MAKSGATKGGINPIRQLAGMRGLMADPNGRIIAMPIRSNFREGLTALEYFLSTHGARKGLADTALRTADAGYLTRRLVDVAQDVIITEIDCGTRSGIWITEAEAKAIGETFVERIAGRFLAGDISDPETGAVLLHKDDLLNEAALATVQRHGVKQAFVRSALSCEVWHLRHVLRRRPGAWRRDSAWRGGRHHCRPVDRRAGHAADAAHLPYGRCGRRR
jgi:DNA-directed RNA polymerase subunit beta'